MKALESSAALRAISTLVEDCREPRRARGAKNIAGAERTFAKRRLRLQRRFIRIHIPCYGDLPLRIISHVTWAE
jgi:hypothetical protein